MEGLPNLNNISYRRSKRIAESKNKLDTNTVPKNLYGFFYMFTIFIVAALATSNSILPTSLSQKMMQYTEKIRSIFDGSISSIKYAAFMCSSSGNDTYIFKDMLQQENRNECITVMMQEM